MLSLIIPTLNEAEALPRTLKDLTPELRQHYQVELIVSDGGSTDGTQALARSLGAQLVEHIPGSPQTIGEGRNAGAAQAHGEVLIFLDADTYPQSWAALLQAATQLVRDPRAVAATVRVQIYPEQRKLSDVVWLELFNLFFFLQNLLGFGMGRGNCQMVRADAFRQLHGYRVTLTASEDYDLFIRLRKLGHIHLFWHMVVNESPRRFRRYGYPKVAWWWFMNAQSMVWRGRAWSKEWRQVR